MKRKLTILAALLCLCLCACGSGRASTSATSPIVQSEAVTQPEATEQPATETAAQPETAAENDTETGPAQATASEPAEGTMIAEITTDNLWDYYELVKDDTPVIMTDTDGNVLTRRIGYQLVLKPEYQIADEAGSYVEAELTGTTETKYGTGFAYDDASGTYTMDYVETGRWSTTSFDYTLTDSGTGMMDGRPAMFRSHLYTGEDYFCGINDVTEVEEIQTMDLAYAEGTLVLARN